MQELQQPDREIFMAIAGETRVLDSDTLEKVNLVDYNSSDFDEFLSDTEAPPDPMEVTNYGPPNKPLGVSVTIHLDEETSEQRKIRNQWRKIWRRASTLRHQQTSDSFNYSNTDLRNIINIGHDARTIIISRKKEREEAEAYSPTSNYKLPDNYDWNPRKRCHVSPASQTSKKQQKRNAETAQEKVLCKLHTQCFLHKKSKHSSFQCATLRKALGAPSISTTKDKSTK